MFGKHKIRIFLDYYTCSKFVPNRSRWERLRKIGYSNIEKCIIGHSLVLDGDNITIKNDCFLNNDIYIECHAEVTIESNVAVGPGTKILTATHDYQNPEARAGEVTHLPVTIGKGAWLGANVTVLPGVTIGEVAVIAAGSVITKNIPAHWLYGGIPAKPIKELQQ